MFTVRDEIIVALIQLLPIIIIWLRLESRLSKLEGSFGMFCELTSKSLTRVEKRRGTQQEGEDYG